MDADLALQKQLEGYRRMSGEERLAIALGLHELACNLAREGIRCQYPQATCAEVEKHLQRRLQVARES